MMEGGIESIEEVEDRPRRCHRGHQPAQAGHCDGGTSPTRTLTRTKRRALKYLWSQPLLLPLPPSPPPVEPPAVDHAFAGSPATPVIPVTDRQGALVRPARFVYQPDSSAPAVAAPSWVAISP